MKHCGLSYFIHWSICGGLAQSGGHVDQAWCSVGRRVQTTERSRSCSCSVRFKSNFYLRNNFYLLECARFYFYRRWGWGMLTPITAPDDITGSICKALNSDDLVPTSSSITGKFLWPSSSDDDDEMFTWTSETTTALDTNSTGGISCRDLSGHLVLSTSSLVPVCKGLDGTSVIG